LRPPPPRAAQLPGKLLMAKSVVIETTRRPLDGPHGVRALLRSEAQPGAAVRGASVGYRVLCGVTVTPNRYP
jgi:hypothetical protein